MAETGPTDLRRVILIVLDGVGIGALPDAHRYGDEGSHSLGHVAEVVGGLSVPNLARLGLGCITPLRGVPAQADQGAYGRMAERSAGKDTTTGHWEIAGVILERPFPVYPHGFPAEVIEAFEAAIGRKVLGNKPASGTAILEELGAEHLRTGYPIVYTSADSVFQIAAHEAVIPPQELYRYCQIARELLQGEHAVGRVIARPFVGEPGSFRRTAGRRDFSLPPPEPTILDRLQEAGYRVIGIGKIADIFAGRGVDESLPGHDNAEALNSLRQVLTRPPEPGLIFVNLIEFDMIWGHRNDPLGYARALQAFDAELPALQAALQPSDLLIITGDHGVDPTTPGTDHTREYVPLLISGPRVRPGVDLGTRATFADIAATISEIFAVPPPRVGTSFLSQCLA